MELPEKLRYVRTDMKLSERKFRKRFGWSRYQLKSWEEKRARPSEAEIKSLTDYDGLNARDFLDDRTRIYKAKELTPNDVVVNDPAKKTRGEPVEEALSTSDVEEEDYGREDNFRYEEKD